MNQNRNQINKSRVEQQLNDYVHAVNELQHDIERLKECIDRRDEKNVDLFKTICLHVAKFEKETNLQYDAIYQQQLTNRFRK